MNWLKNIHNYLNNNLWIVHFLMFGLLICILAFNNYMGMYNAH